MEPNCPSPSPPPLFVTSPTFPPCLAASLSAWAASFAYDWPEIIVGPSGSCKKKVFLVLVCSDRKVGLRFQAQPSQPEDWWVSQKKGRVQATRLTRKPVQVF